jgi:hypothetical protein
MTLTISTLSNIFALHTKCKTIIQENPNVLPKYHHVDIR